MPGTSNSPGRGAVSLPGGVFAGPTPRWRLGGRRRTRARARTREQGPTAFVFAGGGARGSAQVGMLQALMEREIRPDFIYGSSVGAINAAGFASDPTWAGVQRMAELWRGVTKEDVFPEGRVLTPWRFLQQRESVHPNDGVRRIIESGLRFERLEDSPIPFEVVATSLTNGQVHWFSKGKALEAILASAALPALLPPVSVDGEAFIDGGVVDNVPIARAISRGAKRIFALLCGPLRYTPHQYHRPVEAILTAFFIAVHARFARELRELPEGVDVVVFTVDSEPVSRYDDFSGTEALMAAGRANAEVVLDFWAGGGVGERIGLVERSSEGHATSMARRLMRSGH